MTLTASLMAKWIVADPGPVTSDQLPDSSDR